MDLRGARIVITGGAGFIGSHIVELLLKEDVRRVVIVDNFVRGREENLAAVCGDSRVELVRDDIRNRVLMEELCRGTDLLYHEAALRITQCAQEPEEAFAVMGDATFDLFMTAVRSGVKKIVYASSASVYGMADLFPTPETQHPYHNLTLYGGLKVLGEQLLQSLHDMHGIPYVALRYFNVYGPRMDVHGKYTEVIIRWLEALEKGGRPVIFGGGTDTMDFVFVEDVARANILAAAGDVEAGVYNVGAGREVSLKEMCGVILRLTGHPEMTPEYQPPRKINPVARRLADTTKAASDLGFMASVPFDEGMARLYAWWMNNR